MPESPSPEPVEFGIELGRRPELELKTFQGARDVRAAVSPDCSFELLKGALDAARKELLVYIYNVSAPHVLSLLAQARDRGVRVRVMYDAKDTSGDEVQKLKALRVTLKVAPSRDPRRIFDVCHQKFAVVDGRILVLGSANWATSGIPERLPGGRRRPGNREWLLRIDDAGVAGWYRTLFEADFALDEVPAAAEFDIEAREASPPAPSFAPSLDVPLRHFPALSGTITPIVSPDNYYSHVRRLLEAANRRILLQHQYILGDASAPSIRKLLDVVKARKAAGVDVRIMTSSKFASGWERTKTTMREFGLLGSLKAINLGNFIHCHNKGVIADDHVVVSSTNWSENSVRRAREAGLAVQSAPVAAYFAAVFDDDWRNGWTVARADQGPSFDIEPGEETELAAVHPADQE